MSETTKARPISACTTHRRCNLTIRSTYAGTRQLVMSCCAFGNSLTLPLVFLLALLPSAAADRATGYLALFMMGWSPMLWSFGLQLLGRSMPSSQPGPLAAEDFDSILSSLVFCLLLLCLLLLLSSCLLPLLSSFVF